MVDGGVVVGDGVDGGPVPVVTEEGPVVVVVVDVPVAGGRHGSHLGGGDVRARSGLSRPPGQAQSE